MYMNRMSALPLPECPWGSNYRIRIRKAGWKGVRLSGDVVESIVGADGLTITAAPDHPTLDDLLAGVTPENLHDSSFP